ncbi:MAG: aminotransferase class III-fold pyridoxal phosphate-dependent enzyme [Methylotenera sp.]
MKNDLLSIEGFSALNPDRLFLLKHIGFNTKITKARGHYYFDEAGNAYLDFLAQYGAVPFGHNPAELWEAINLHGSEYQPSFVQPLISPSAEDLAAKLVQLAPGNMRYVTFVNSGAEATEASIKLARVSTKRQIILSTIRGFHGKTLGALSATDNPAYRDPFLIDTTCFERIPFNDLDALEARLKSCDVAAFLVEPVQGEGGMRVPSPGYLLAAAEICRRYGTLFVLDEVQTGLGRTGKLFAADGEPGLSPDIILLSKALGGGIVPLGAMLCTKDVWSEDFGFYHSSTFANSHFTCSIGCKTLDMLLANDRKLVCHAKEMGEYLQQGLDQIVSKYPKAFVQRNGSGLMQAIVLAPWHGESSYFLAIASMNGYSVPLLAGYLFKEHRIVTAPVFNQNSTLRLEPSLTIEKFEIDCLLKALDEAGRLITAEDFSTLLSFVTDGTFTGPTIKKIPRNPVIHEPNYQLPRASEERRGTFAFLVHPTDDVSLFNSLPPDFVHLDQAQKTSCLEWMHSWSSRMYDPAVAYHLPAMRSKAGGYVEGWLIACPLIPKQMISLSKKEKKSLLEAYLKISRELNVNITGLGAYTSVISRGGKDVLDQDLNLTTGNSLTAIASAESLRAVAALRGKDLSAETVAVIGAAGSVGRLASLHLGRYSKSMILFGNPKNPNALGNLQLIAGEIYRTASKVALKQVDAGLPELLLDNVGPVELTLLLETIPADDFLRFKLEIEERLARTGITTPPIMISNSLESDLGKADIVLSASAAGESFIDPHLFSPDSIVCDVARPLDVLGSVQAERADVFVYEGGILKLPEHISFGAQNALSYPRGYNLACLSETIVLAMDGAQRSYSIGNTIEYAEALDIYDKSLHHGFKFEILIGDIQIDTSQIEITDFRFSGDGIPSQLSNVIIGATA